MLLRYNMIQEAFWEAKISDDPKIEKFMQKRERGFIENA